LKRTRISIGQEYIGIKVGVRLCGHPEVFLRTLGVWDVNREIEEGEQAYNNRAIGRLFLRISAILRRHPTL
jgi:hypothetical protein